MKKMRLVALFAVATAAAQAVLGAIVARRWYRSWGTTPLERSEALPGDAEVEFPTNAQTHAVHIEAAPEDVWPWIVQLGTGRAGWYSYDAIENAMGLGVHSSDRIEPALQELREGDRIPLAPDVALPVTWLDPGRLLLLAAHDAKIGDCSWLFLLRPQRDGSTRLITRFRVRWEARGLAKALLALVEPGSFVMERKMLLGIKERAERLARERAPVPVVAAV